MKLAGFDEWPTAPTIPSNLIAGTPDLSQWHRTCLNLILETLIIGPGTSGGDIWYLVQPIAMHARIRSRPNISISATLANGKDASGIILMSHLVCVSARHVELHLAFSSLLVVKTELVFVLPVHRPL